MNDHWSPATATVGSLRGFLWASAVAAAVLVGAATWTWPPATSPTAISLMVLLAIGEANPVNLRHHGRSESIVIGELAAAIAAAILPIDQLVWVVIGGSALTPPTVRFLAAYERVRSAPASRHVLNVSKNIIGLSGLVGLAVLTSGHGIATRLLAIGAGLVVHAMVTTLMVRAAINRSVQAPPPPRTTRDVVDSLAVAAALAVVTALFAVALPPEAPAWPNVVVLSVALVLVSRARMGREMAAFRLTAVTNAVQQLSSATSPAEFDARVRSVVAHALVAGRVDVTHRPPTADSGEHVAGQMGDDGPWVVATQPRLRAPWTRLDRDLLDAILAAAIPERRRLELMARMAESERFASLVLTAAGHDVANQLHVAAMAVQTVIERQETLQAHEQQLVLERARTAMDRAGSALRDMVAVGASGPGTEVTGGTVALFVRRLSPRVRVTATNVRIAAPATVVERAVENLVLQALRHHGDGEPLDVIVRGIGDEVVIEVCDRGPGLSPDQVDTLMQPFTQLTDQRRRRGSLGLGLLIARGLAENVGGSLDYQGRPGGGAIFGLRLPSADGGRERVQERVVLGPGPDRHTQATVEPRLA